MGVPKWVHRLLDRFGPARRLHVIAGDRLPPRMPARDLVLAVDDGEPWSIGIQCPCRCGDVIEMLVIPGARPRWDFTIDDDGRPTLSPSVWRNVGCKSHFWLRKGRVHWC
ncbi:hypothetical protein JEQ47_16905 [Devosia sp. MSA67]|uniref:Uncharacterized protein n=1 Tax=Devosia sediminis TaxID=2798801 RepID=A0A934MLM8_9HYPH|nr:hypothetical protein [Devosia sediminis]